MTTEPLACASCGATHYDVPNYVTLIRCLICGAPMHPKKGLTGADAVIYSDSNEAAMRGKGGQKMNEGRLASSAQTQEGEVMARKTQTDEIDELVDELDELEDEDLDVDVEDVEDADEDPDEAPKRKRTRKARVKKEKPEKTGIGTAEVAEAAGIESRQLRMFLRAREIQPRDDRDGRYVWSSLNDPEVKMILREIAKGEAKKANDERLADLKEKRAAKKSTAKKSTTRRRKAAASDDE